MNLDFKGKVIAFTGASRGVGLAIARHVVTEGAAVAIAARSAAELGEAHDAIETLGGRCLAYACDLAVPGEAAAFIASVVEIFGRLDGLVCNGTMALKGGSEREAWQAELALNVGHAIEAVEAAVPMMAGEASILLLAWAEGDAGPAAGWPAAAARAALGEAARRFARDLVHQDIRVNVLLTGEEAFADTAAFLLSHRATGVTGARLP